ncbi:Uncharacterized protein DBV15_05988 [Temnothorax longispinosus]|uniref:Uncharacterized protein n=1 Tax=Temnothorax longispinosus TaxID=300112 RepID=A0A4S2KMS5_9HYME|nr:Uncharacterized protein DBV15_05988 [Temnothorax longispinosus]
MSPTIPILSALLLSLISGSAEGGQRTGFDLSLRQTLGYWWKMYKAYKDEMALGYCWAEYLFKNLQPNGGLQTNVSVPSSAATWNDSDTIVGTTKSQEGLFPQNVTVKNAVTPFGETQEGQHPREQRLQSTTSKSINDPDEHRVKRVASRSKTIQRRKRWTMNKIGRVSRAVSSNYTERNNEIDEKERIASTVDYAKKRQRTLSIVMAELWREVLGEDGHESSSRGTGSHAVNPTPNSRYDDKVDFGSTDLGEEDSRRKVLRPLTSHRDSIAEDALASRSFSLKVIRGVIQRFPFRSSSSSQKRNLRVDEMLSDPWAPREDHEIEDDPAGPRDPLNNDGSSSTPSRSQFRRVNASAEHPRTSVVKLMDFEGNSSRNPTINSKTSRRKPEELSRDSLLSPHGGRAIAERSFLESPGSGGKAVKRNAFMQFKTVSGSDTKKRDSQRPREEESSRDGRDVSTAIHPSFLSEFRRSRRQALHENHSFLPDPTIPRKSRQDNDLVRTARSVPSLSNDRRFIGDYEGSTNQSAQHSKLIALRTSRNSNELSLAEKPTMRTFIIAAFRTLVLFIEVGRLIMDAISSDSVFAIDRVALAERLKYCKQERG